MILALMLGTAVTTLIFSDYIVSSFKSGGISLGILQKNPEATSNAGDNDVSGSSITESPAATDTAAPSPEITNSPTGDGTTLVISGTLSGSASGSGSRKLTFQEIYRRVIPSVVSIVSTLQTGSASGTGIIMSEDGYIITNYHVVEDSSAISVTLENGDEFSAALVGSDEQSDLAVLKIDAESLTAAEFGDSDALEVGDTVLAIGNPLGTDLKGTLTDGIISAINRDIIVDGREMTLLQTNAALNSGNSGGPLINIYGQIIGINTMKISSYYSSVEGLGFAIPISTAKGIIDELIEKGYVSGRPTLGIKGSDLPSSAAAFYQVPQGVYVESVDTRSDAYVKGLMRGDIIVAINGITITTMDELKIAKNKYAAGDTVTLNIYRSGTYIDLDVVLIEEGTLR